MFRRLLISAGISGLGDGVTRVSGTLLAASLTRSPLAVAGLAISQLTAVSLLALPAGTLVDRVDRRSAMIAACVIRVLTVAALACWLAAGPPPLAALYAVYLALGLAGVVQENAASAMLPAVAGPGALERANGRLQSASGFSQSMVAQPLAAVLFTTAVWLPFAADAAGLLAVASLSAGLPSLAPAITERSIWPDMRAGLRWLAGSRQLGALSLAVAASNIGLGAVFSVFVLIVRERYGAGPVGYTALLTVIAVAGLAGGLAAGRVVTRFGRVRVLRAEMVTEALTHAGLLLVRSPVAAGALLAVLSFQLAIFSSVSATLRQTVPPPDMLGRAHGAYRAVSGTGMLLGAVLGGMLSDAYGLTAPFWLGLAGMCMAIAYGWNRILPGGLLGRTFPYGKCLVNEEEYRKMRARIGRVLFATAAATAAVALTASQALAATWTVTGGGTIHSSLSKGTTLSVSVKTTTFGTITLSCKTATLSGTLPNGKGLSGTGIGHITGATFGSSSNKCTGPAGSTGTGTITKGSKWSFNAVSFAGGVTTGTITGVSATVSFNDPLGACTAVVAGTAKDTYTNTTGILKLTGASLSIKSSSGTGCGGSLTGDTASLSTGTGGYSVLNTTGGHPKITSP